LGHFSFPLHLPSFLIPAVLLCAFFLFHYMFTPRTATIKKATAGLKSNDQADQARRMMLMQMQTQEETLQKISTEIHDNISMLLTISKLFLTDLDFKDSVNVEKKVNESISFLVQAIHDLNNLSRSLSSDQLDRFGLPACIQSLTDRMNAIGVDIRFKCEGEYQPLSGGNELILFRIVQEALKNSLNHSHASSIEIILACCQQFLSITIKDNGIGFDQSKMRETNAGTGLSNMSKRAQLLNAKLIINSNHSSGTSVSIQVPLLTYKPANANRKHHNQNCPC
jgi:two-component system, NarL family, sensor kinase